jgi:3-deoxy-D-manno-octulosonic-acid transferase
MRLMAFYILYALYVATTSIFYIFILFGIYIFGKEKGRKGIKGRKKIFKRLYNIAKNIKDKKVIWIHVASRGELEQAKPIIREIKNLRKDVALLITVFSPSGYDENIQNEKENVYISYLPFDTIWNAYRFYKIIKPNVGIFIRYEFWLNYLVLGKMFSNLLLFNATVDSTKPKILYYGIYSLFSYIGCVDEEAYRDLTKINEETHKYEIVGDSRIEQVIYRKNVAKKKRFKPFLNDLKGRSIIVGSSWKEDETMFFNIAKELFSRYKHIKIVIAPHEITKENISRIEREIRKRGYSYIKYTDNTQYGGEEFVIIDVMGILTELYRFGYIAYIGGGFGAGIHNIIEPIIMDNVVIFGKNFQNSREAKALLKKNCVFSIHSSYELLLSLFKLLENKELYQKALTCSKDYIKHHIGSSKKYVMVLEKYL